MDCSASWQFVVDAIGADWRFVAPDWRGFGLSDWATDGVYGYQDYVADLDAIATICAKDDGVCVVGHSMGGNIASLYASVRPERVKAVVNVEGFGLRARAASEAPDVLRTDPGHNRVWPQIYRLDEAQAHWARIRVPYLWVEADESQNAARHGISSGELDLRRDSVPGAARAMVRGAGHMAHLEQPGQVAALIERFLIGSVPGVG